MEREINSLRLQQVNRVLAEPVSETFSLSDEYGATFNALGVYSPTQFVMRLAPGIHELVDALGEGNTDGRDPDDIFTAYSTFLHETIHWWQHIGSTSGLIMSLSYPAQCSSAIHPLKAVAQKYGPQKPLNRWADEKLRAGGIAANAELADANEAVNNILDVEFYKIFATSPMRAEELFEHPHFECVGHSYGIAYGNTLRALFESCGISTGSLAPPDDWGNLLQALRTIKHEGFYHGSPIRRARVGLRDIYEGQARLNQLQLLWMTGGPIDCAHYRSGGYFEGVYISAFEEFLRLTGFEWPEHINSPLVALFLLICDLAINPTRGFPLPIEEPRIILIDVDPGMRFSELCVAAGKYPELKDAIQSCSRDDYIQVSHILTRACAYDHPIQALEDIVGIINSDAGVGALMEEWATFRFTNSNLVFRLITAAFLSFCRDKLEHPEFFCWSGLYWLDRENLGSAPVFQRNLPLYVDRADTEKIFARVLPGRDRKDVWDTRVLFFANLLIYDLIKQWVLGKGPFHYDFYWLTGTHQNDDLITYAKNQFEKMFGIHPDAFDRELVP